MPQKFKSEDQFDLIKSDNRIRDYLRMRFIEGDYSYREICEDADRFGVKIEPSALSKYIKHRCQAKGSIRHDQVLWLCKRYGINVKLTVETMPKPLKRDVMVRNAYVFLKRIKEARDYYEKEGQKLDRNERYPERFEVR